MAINKVVIGNNTIMDISNTTALQTDVQPGKYFYDMNGDRLEGTCSLQADTSTDTVEPGYVKQGVTFHDARGGAKESAITGTVVWNEESTPVTLAENLPEAKTAAYYNGITFHVDETLIKPDNIRNNIKILGVTGTYEGTEIVEPSKYIQAGTDYVAGGSRYDTILPDTTPQAYTALAKVEVGKIWYTTSTTTGTTGLTADVHSLTKE